MADAPPPDDVWMIKPYCLIHHRDAGTVLPEFRDLDAYRAAEEVSLNRSILMAVACGLMTIEQVEAKLTEIYRKRLEATSDANLPQVGSFHG